MPAGINGVVLFDLGEWAKSGVELGDVLTSTNITGGVSDADTRRKALSAPDGTEIIIIRNTERIKIVLGKGIVDRAELPLDQS